MKVADALLLDFDEEISHTRRILERVPEDKPQWKPHEKSMPLGQLAMHVAQLPQFAALMLTGDEFDMATQKFPDHTFASTANLLATLEDTSRETRSLLEAADDQFLLNRWKLRFGDKTLFDAPRAVLIRTMFLNHLVHHRGQLSVYLRLNDVPVPGIYGPSADENL